MQRAVAFFVMFHQMGKDVQDWWPMVSLGFLNYDMSRTHSIMRVATTASPISGSEVRDKTLELALINQMKKAKASLAALIIYKRSKKGVLQPEDLTRHIALNSATAKRLIQESKQNLITQITQSENRVETEPIQDSSGLLKHQTFENVIELSQNPPPPPPRHGLHDDTTNAVLIENHESNVAQQGTIKFFNTPTGAPLPQQPNGLQDSNLHAPGNFDENAKVTLHQSSRNGYWVMRPVWVPLADNDLSHPEKRPASESGIRTA